MIAGNLHAKHSRYTAPAPIGRQIYFVNEFERHSREVNLDMMKKEIPLDNEKI